MEALSRRGIQAGRGLRAAPIHTRLFSARLTVTLLISIVTVVMRTGGFPWITCTPSSMLQQH